MRTTVSWLVFSKKLDPPIHEHDYIKKSIDTRGIEDAPFSQNVAGDFTTFKRPPRRLNGSPPCENRVYEVREGPFAFCVVGKVGGAGSG